MDDEMKLKVIQEIMDDLQDKMQDGPDDFDERLGKKPDVAAMVVAGKGMPGDDDDGDMPPMGGDQDMPMDMGMMDDESPEEKLKARIMKMRG